MTRKQEIQSNVKKSISNSKLIVTINNGKRFDLADSMVVFGD